MGDRVVQLSAQEVLDLQDARGEKPVELRSVGPFTDDLIDPDLANAFLKGVVDRNGLRMPLTLTDALINKRLVVEPGASPSLTLAGAVALARTPSAWIPGARLRFLRFEGTDEKFGAARNATKDRWFDGPVPKIVEEFRQFMRTQVRELEYLGSDARVVREIEYPEEAWEEAVVNALVHRSYALTASAVFVRMFEDRIEIESPGGFPGRARPNEEGIVPLSAPRNHVLAQALQYLGLVWLAREGTRRMHDRMLEMRLPVPRLVEADDGAKVVVTLSNDWERRSGRGRGMETGKEWEEVADLLADDLAIRRKKGIEKWSVLSQRGSNPPPSVLRIAEKAMHAAHLSPQEKEAIVDNIGRLPDVARIVILHDLFAAFVGGQFSAMPGVASRLAFLVAQMPDDSGIEMVLAHLEGQLLFPGPPATAEHYEHLTLALAHRIHRDPVPPAQWLNRVIRLCRPGSPNAANLYTEITGKALQAP